jgi:hypothetical protein
MGFGNIGDRMGARTRYLTRNLRKSAPAWDQPVGVDVLSSAVFWTRRLLLMDDDPESLFRDADTEEFKSDRKNSPGSQPCNLSSDGGTLPASLSQKQEESWGGPPLR